jgi:hypothetical protein
MKVAPGFDPCVAIKEQHRVLPLGEAFGFADQVRKTALSVMRPLLMDNYDLWRFFVLYAK